MSFFREKPVVIEAITFDEFVEYGRKATTNIVNGMPWSFEYKGHPVSHENDRCYLIQTMEETHNFTPEDVLITGVKGEIYPCKKDIFAATYEPEHDENENQVMTFGQALEALKAGKKVARAGWNGKGMWLVLVNGTPLVQLKPGTPYAKALNMDSCEILPHIDMWTVNALGRRAMLPGWLASQTDMLAEDWLIVE